MISGNSLFLDFSGPEIEENKKFITRSIQLVYISLTHISYIHTICSLWIIKPTKVHLSTIYSISKVAFSPKKIVIHWTHNKS